MIPASDEEIGNIRIDFLRFLNIGESELKAMWHAVSGRGFTLIIESNKDSVKIQRETDGKFIICTYPLKETERVSIMRDFRKVDFHVNETIFKN